jgi:hypothetical protein
MTARELEDALLFEALAYHRFIAEPSDETRQQWLQRRKVIDAVISGLDYRDNGLSTVASGGLQ